MSAGTLFFTPRPTAAYAPTPTSRARRSRNSSAPRRRRWTNCIRAPACCATSGTPRGARRGRLVGGDVLHGALGLGQAAGADSVLNGAVGVGVELVDPHGARLVGVGQGDARDVGL